MLISELIFKAIRSSGSGGQHVNKVASKVEAQFDIITSKALTEEEKERLQQNLRSRLTKNNILILQCGESRSQHQNKTIVTSRIIELIEQALVKRKKRKPTKTPRTAIKKRLENKKIQSAKKAGRKKPDLE